MTDTGERQVSLRAPGHGAYRITVRGDEATNVATGLSVAGQPVELTMQPGRYSALVESLSSPGTTEQDFAVPPDAPQRLEIGLGDDPDQAVNSQITQLFRPSQASVPTADLLSALPKWSGPQGDQPLPKLVDSLVEHQGDTLKALVADAHAVVQARRSPDSAHDALPETRQGLYFSLGISADTRPEARGGWRAGEICCELHSAPTGELKLKLWSATSLSAFQRRRLTISVQGDVAWRAGLPLFPDGVWLMLRPTLGPRGADVVATMRPVREQTAILIGALERALPEEVNGILGAAAGLGVNGISPDGAELNSSAMAALYDKADDPWAAAAAALLLVRTGQSAQAIDWTINLADRFPWLPDASVAACWAEVAAPHGDVAEAELRSIKRLGAARSWGAAYFAGSNFLALQMLTALAFGSTPDVRRAAKRERAYWVRHGRRAIRVGAFLAWELPGNNLTSGRLPSASYKTIVEGVVSSSMITPDLVTADRAVTA